MKHFDSKAFESALSKSFIAYEIHGPRSPKKLTPVHGYLAHSIREASTNKYEVIANGGPHDTEAKIEGAFYTKAVDIVVAREGAMAKAAGKVLNPANVVVCVGVKIISSNYHQNKNNYFEGMIGETSNIQSTGVPYGQIIGLPIKMPYFKNGTTGGKDFDHWENVSGVELDQYIRLQESLEGPHRPAFIGLVLFDRNYEDNSIRILSSTEVGLLNSRASKQLDIEPAWQKLMSFL
jgi:hypothetical protein